MDRTIIVSNWRNNRKKKPSVKFSILEGLNLTQRMTQVWIRLFEAPRNRLMLKIFLGYNWYLFSKCNFKSVYIMSKLFFENIWIATCDLKKIEFIGIEI